jgi:hypothetical protein
MEIERGRATVRMRLNGLALTDLAEFTRLVVGAERYDNQKDVLSSLSNGSEADRTGAEATSGVQGRAHRRHY